MVDFLDSLNGRLVTVQRNETRTGFVSVTDPARFSTVLKPSDKNYISTAPTVLSYWFLDCVYYGITADMQFEFNFTKSDEPHVVETLIIGDFSPLPPPVTLPPSTTSTPPTTTPQTPTTSHTVSMSLFHCVFPLIGDVADYTKAQNCVQT